MKKEQVQKTLESLKAGLASKEITEQSTSFIFTGGRVISYNDEVSVRADLNLGFEGCLPADLLLKFLSKAKGEEIEVGITGGEKEKKEVVFSCSKGQAGFPLTEEIPEGPVSLTIPEKGWKKIPDDLLEATASCLSSAAKDLSHPALNCIHIREGGIVEACDGFQATVMETKETKESLLLPRDSVSYLVSLDPAPEEFVLDEAWSHWRTESGCVFSCRTVEGDYPDLSQIISLEGEETTITFPKEVKGVVDRARVFASSLFVVDQRVEIKLRKGGLVIRGEGPDGWYKERMKAKGEDLSFTIHPDLLTRILQHSLEATVVKGEDRSLLRFRGKNYVHVVAL